MSADYVPNDVLSARGETIFALGICKILGDSQREKAVS